MLLELNSEHDLQLLRSELEAAHSNLGSSQGNVGVLLRDIRAGTSSFGISTTESTSQTSKEILERMLAW